MSEQQHGITPELYRLPDVIRALAISRSTVYALMSADPSFPKPVQVTSRAIRWHREDVVQWARSRPAARPPRPPRR